MRYRYLLIAFLVLALFHRLGYMPLIFEEPRRTEVAIEMILNDNYIVPTINDIYYYNKPPLHNWMLAGVFKLFNTYSEFAARSTTVISLLLIGLLVFSICRRFLSENSAWLAMIFTLTTGDIFYRFSLLAEIDIFYTLIVFLQGISIIYFWKKKNLWLLFTVSYMFCAAGFLTKGITSLAFQALTLLGWAIAFGQTRKLFSIQHIAGILVLLFVSAIYFYSYSAYHDPFIFLSKLLAESSEKTISTGVQSDHIFKWLSFPFMFFQVILPWGIMLILANRSYFNHLKNNDLLKFSLVFIIANVIAYWISPGSRPRYLYPFVPFAMIILANLADQNLFQFKSGKMIQYLFGGIILVSGMAIIIAPAFDLPESISYPWIIAFTGGGTIAMLAYLYFRHQPQRIWIFIAFMITFRIIFNFTILPVRYHEIEQSRDFKRIVADILEDSEGEKIWLYAPKNVKMLKPVFFGIRFPEKEYEFIEWPPFQLSFYFASYKSDILRLSDKKDRGILFLADSNHLVNENIEIVNTYPITGKNKNFILFRFGSAESEKYN